MTDTTLLPVKYIGPRAKYLDGTFGTYAQFVKGETLLIPRTEALKMFEHPSVYVPGDATPTTAIHNPAKKSQEDLDELELQDIRDSLASMEKGALAEFAKTKFNMELDKRKSVETLRGQCVMWVDQYGLS